MPSFRSFLLFTALASLSAADRTPTTFLTLTPTVTTLFPLPAVPSASTSASPEPCSCAPPPPSTIPCTPCAKGYLTCLDNGTHFAVCTGGKPTTPKPIAPGYKCQPRSGPGLEISRA
ncbi:hypothetical protein GGR58DRAFT_396143 [Xylaria digitata]|nr:hypothetical protein GGR58DRAFT_396143 [Xylaria digitata]